MVESRRWVQRAVSSSTTCLFLNIESGSRHAKGDGQRWTSTDWNAEATQELNGETAKKKKKLRLHDFGATT